VSARAGALAGHQTDQVDGPYLYRRSCRMIDRN